MKYITAHFSAEEFACHNTETNTTTPYPSLRERQLATLCETLETIRAEMNKREDRPVRLIVTSGYRTNEWNKLQGGAPRSYHVRGQAADIQAYRLKQDGNWRLTKDWKRLSAKKLGAVVTELMDNKKIIPGGIGYYETFIHVDTRTRRAFFGTQIPDRKK